MWFDMMILEWLSISKKSLLEVIYALFKLPLLHSGSLFNESQKLADPEIHEEDPNFEIISIKFNSLRKSVQRTRYTKTKYPF